MIKNNKKLLGVMKTEKILLYSPLLKWYLNHGLQVTKIHRYISYTSGRPFKWFPEEVSSARRDADNDKNKKQLGDTAKLKGNSFYGKMIENLEKHMNTKLTTNEKLIDNIFRSPFFEDLEEINEGVFEVRQRKKQVTITRPYQCGLAVYQLAKLRMLEFYYDFLDKFCNRRDFELIQMDTDSFYMALSAEDFDEIIKPEMKELYKEEKKNWLVTDEYSKRVPGLFKAEFQGKRMIALTSKCYFADSGGGAGAKLGGDEGIKKFSCKGVSRRQNKMNWERYKNALFGSLDKARNIGFRKRDNHIVTYEQSKLGLSAELRQKNCSRRWNSYKLSLRKKMYFKGILKDSHQQSELIGKHIHHALCGHGGEFSVKMGGKKIFVDGYEPKTRTIFQYHGCKWHGCPCQKERNSLDEKKYSKTIELQEKMKEQGFKLFSVWECEKPELKKMELEKEFRPYPYFIVYDFEALHKKMDEPQTEELVITSRHVPVSVAINDNLTNEPVFIVDQDPGNLINSFMEELKKRQIKIAQMVECLYPQPESDDGKEKKEDPIWRNWVNQVPVFGFNSGRYDINMIKEYFVKNLAIISDVNVAKKENSYMFLSTSNFKFLDIKNYLAPGLSYDAWCRAYGCELQKLAFPYEWFDSFEKLNHKGPVKYEEFYSSLKGGITISQEEYQNFCDEFHKRGCVTMKDWLKEYNLADVTPFIEALEKTREQYYPDEIDLLKDAVSIPGISMMYVLNEALKRKKYSEPDLFAPGEPCKCECSSDDCGKTEGCEKCKEIRDNCKICTKNEAYEMLKTGMIGGPSIVFCRYAEAGVSKIRSHIYSEKAKTCRSVHGLDSNSLYLFCSGQEMPCGKEKVFKCNTEAKPEQSRSRAPSSAEQDEIIQNVLNGKLFGFFEVDIEVPEQKRKRFSEFCPLFVISEVPEAQIPQHMKDYKINTGRK